MAEVSNNIRWINKGDKGNPMLIAHGINEKHGTYIGEIFYPNGTRFGDTPIRMTSRPVSLFWHENPPDPTYSKYFILYFEGSAAYISSGAYVENSEWLGREADNGEIVFARFMGDARESEDRTAFADSHLPNARGRRCILKLQGADFVFERYSDDNDTVASSVSADRRACVG